MATNTSRLDEDAAAWEADPACRTSCKLAYQALLQHVPQLQPGEKKPDILEVGCGSGVLSAMLAPHAHTLVGTDISESIVAAFNANAAARGAGHMEAICYDASRPDFTAAPNATARLIQKVDGQPAKDPLRWDVVLSNTLAHHIADMHQWMQIAYFSLAPGGTVGIVDFENTGPDTALFHATGKRGGVVAHGVKRDEIAKFLEDAGFVDVSVKRVFSMDKAVAPEEAGGRTSIEFPFVLCRGSKPVR